MKKLFALAVPVLFAVSASAEATITAIASNARSRVVTVDYTLTGSAAQIVTVEFFEDGNPVSEREYANVVGDVNRLVEPTADGEVRRIVWQTDAVAADRATLGTITARLSVWTKENPPDYMVFDFADCQTFGTCHVSRVSRYYVSTNSLPGGIGDIRYRQSKMVFRRIPAAGVEWYMGSPEGESGRSGTEGRETRHLVRLTKDYYMAVFETTYGQGEYVLCGYYANKRVDNSLEKNGDPTYALGSITYGYLKNATTDSASSNLAIGTLRKMTGVLFDLPTEAEWEFACRAGTGTALNSNQDLDNTLTSARSRALGWIYYKTGGPAEDGNAYGPRSVGLKAPNAWGLYDMVGNVSELCRDLAYGTFAASDVAVENPLDLTAGGSSHVLRGGRCDSAASDCRSAARSSEGNAGANMRFGFRLVAPIPLN